MPISIQAPAGFVPEAAISFAGAIGAVRVGAESPLPIAERSFQGAVPVVVDTEQPPQRAIAIVASVGGDVTLKLADASTMVVPVTTGLSILPFAVRAVIAAGTSATATYANLV